MYTKAVGGMAAGRRWRGAARGAKDLRHASLLEWSLPPHYDGRLRRIFVQTPRRLKVAKVRKFLALNNPFLLKNLFLVLSIPVRIIQKSFKCM